MAVRGLTAANMAAANWAQQNQQANNPQAAIQQLLASMQSGNKSANAAGQQQYQQIMNQFGQTQQGVMDSYGQALSGLANMGQTAKQRIDDDRLRQAGAANQGLISRGLGNTTVRQGVMRGVNRDAQQAMTGVDEAVAAQKSGLLQSQAGAQMGLGQLGIDTILSKQNNPMTDQYLALIAALSR